MGRRSRLAAHRRAGPARRAFRGEGVWYRRSCDMRPPPQRFESYEGPLCERLVEALLLDGLSVEIRVSGSSMSPFIRPGDLVVLEPPGAQTLGVGDVLAFLRAPGRLAIHRVVGWSGGALVLRGDGARMADGPIERSAIVGRVRQVRRSESPVKLGLGPERRLIAFLSRIGALAPLIDFARGVLRPTRGNRAR